MWGRRLLRQNSLMKFWIRSTSSVVRHPPWISAPSNDPELAEEPDEIESTWSTSLSTWLSVRNWPLSGSSRTCKAESVSWMPLLEHVDRYLDSTALAGGRIVHQWRQGDCGSRWRQNTNILHSFMQRIHQRQFHIQRRQITAFLNFGRQIRHGTSQWRTLGTRFAFRGGIQLKLVLKLKVSFIMIAGSKFVKPVSWLVAWKFNN